MTLDLNDQLQAGASLEDPESGAKPANTEAEKAANNESLRLYSVRQLLIESCVRACKPRDERGICPTGHWEIDSLTAGFRPGFTWVIAADTSVGKSSWLISAADEGIQAGRRILIVSSEDAPQVYGDRLMARRAQISADNLRKRRLTRDEVNKVAAVAERAEEVPVYVEAGNRPIEKLEKELRAIVRLEGIDMIAFDYLQEFNSARKHQDERTKYKHIARVMRWLIKSENKTGIILSQLTISGDTKIPNRHNIRECRDVANGAEVIGLLFESDQNIFAAAKEKGDEPKLKFKANEKYFLLDKNKDGPRGASIKLAWNAHSACFDTVKDPEQERIEAEAEHYNRRIGIDDSMFDN